jgi:tripartite-type tricarboxylate transporter receptor subunit TctC
MHLVPRCLRAPLAAIALLLLSSSPALAYPDKPVRIVVPFAAGGFTDAMARRVAKDLADRLGQQFIVENRTGAGGNIAGDAVAKAPPDGYTLFISTITTHGINPTLYAKMPFDPVKDFAPVILLASVPNVLVVNRSDIKTVEQLRELARSKPGGLNVASSGVGTSSHLVSELFREATSIRMTHIPFKGSSQALTDLIGQQVDLMFDNLMFQAPHVQAGKVFAIGVTSATRSPVLPNVPTMNELGIKGMDYGPWFGVSAPAGTPVAVVNKLNAEIRAILGSADFKKAMTGADLMGGSPDEYGVFVRAEMTRWRNIIEQARIEKQQ